MLTEWGLKQNQIKIISVLGSKQGVEHVIDEFPDVEVRWLVAVAGVLVHWTGGRTELSGTEADADARFSSARWTRSSRRRGTSRPGSAMRYVVDNSNQGGVLIRRETASSALERGGPYTATVDTD